MATTVPYGERVSLARGGVVGVVQRLGKSITVRTEMGLLLRIDEEDADALGLEPPGSATASTDSSGTRVVVGHRSLPEGEQFNPAHVIDALQGIYDPEIPVSIVELGLVYRCEETTTPDGGRRIEIDMSMTAPGCGMGDVLRADAMRAVKSVPGVDEVEVNLVWDPPWNIQRMSEAARLQLGLL
jgi:probable FeS assembly SUF system protein SufT